MTLLPPNCLSTVETVADKIVVIIGT